MKYLNAIILAAAVLSGGCGQSAEQNDGPGEANVHMNQTSFEELAASFESPDRDAWQRPDAVVAALGDITGKTIMDIGSGTGYFSFRLVDAGANVICADIDERFLDYIATRKEQLGIPDDRMELRHVPYDSSTLQPGEVDMVLLVDTYHHILDRETYFAEVRAGIRPGGQLVIVDFFKREMPVGPPVEMKLDRDTIVDELRAAGFEQFEINDELLPYQYIITAS